MKKVLFYIFVLGLVSVFLYSGYRLINKLLAYKQIEDTYDNIAKLVVQTVPTIAATESDESLNEPGVLPPTQKEEEQSREELTESTAEAPSPYTTMVAPIQVDFETLCSINPDIVGWIYCEGTSIHYPVLKGEDNDTYLRQQYDGTYSFSGSIFMDYRCDESLSENYTIIYGHNMLTNAMFNSLDRYRNQEYLEEHSRFFYLTPYGKNYCFEVICSNVTAYKDQLRLFELRDDERNLELIRSCAEADSGIEASNEDDLVLLATCAYDYKNARFTLLCKVEEIGE